MRPRASRPSRAPPDAALVLAAVFSILLLVGLAAWLEPPLVSLGDAQEGARVAVEARVLQSRALERAQLLVLADHAHRMPAFAPLAPRVERGDEVRAEGVVSRDEGGLVLSASALALVRAAAEVERVPGELAASPEAFAGSRLLVRGEVRGDALVGGGARVGLRGDELPPRGPALVTGTFSYRELDASYVLWVESWTPPT